MTRVLVTGANGFVGSALCRLLHSSGLLVRGAVRDRAKLPHRGVSESKDREWMMLHDQSSEDETRHALQEVSAVVHLAGPGDGLNTHMQIVNSIDNLHMCI